MTETQPTLKSLAATIAQSAEAITVYLNANNIPAPSFAEDSPFDYPKTPEILGTLFQLIDALSDLQHLILGASDGINFSPIFESHDSEILDVLNQFDFWNAVPLGGSASYSEIARKTTLPEPLVRRVLRHAFLSKLFAEASPGQVVHTAKTAYVAKTPRTRSWIALNLEQIRPATVYLAKSLREYSAGKNSHSQEPLESAFAIADLDRTGRPVDFWTFLKNDPDGKPKGYRANRFAEAMQAISASSSIKPDEIVKLGFDWNSLGEATVVDLGGSRGHDAIAQAKHFPKLKYIVQDLPEVEEAFNSNLPKELAHRVSFQPHDFFQPQNIQADVYFMKVVLHDWPDKYAAQIVNNLLPYLKKGSRLVLCEGVQPESYDVHGNAIIPLFVRRLLSSMDLQMLVGANCLERRLTDWKDLLAQVDKKLEIRNVASFPGAVLSIINIGYNT
ncbi:hypothetical protein OIDMADRAFT_138176 [Oidiodendron maius Zn]|uniref:O-methyltransferase C-terminal domain-containing protein n=1 Tax=Oidiodendron maius (strain Zn) TaxID=913774 RepID=A0A0C3CUA0_OIDMZ|nr:hypothetical protein OIDMADRAFT_138176 [Oidiodendron maius Zn]